MKVCLLTSSFPRYPGDYAGVFVYDLARWLAQLGIEVAVVAPHESGLPKREKLGEITVNRFSYMIPARWQRIAYLGGIPANLRRYWIAWVQLPFFLLSFVRLARKVCQRCDLIHAHWFFSGLVALMAVLGKDKPIVLTAHGSDVNLLTGNRLFRQSRMFVANRIDRIIAVSNQLATKIGAVGVRTDKIAVIPNGVDTTTFRHPADIRPFAYRLVWVGRLVPEKGVEVLLEAFADVIQTFPQATLTLVGDGPLRPKVEAISASLGLDTYVRFTGQVSHDDIASYLTQADLFVLPSLSEGLPLVLLEAMSMGKPVVASNVGGIPDVLESNGSQQTGVLIPPGESRALSRAILEVFRDPENARTMGLNGRALIEGGYTWAAIAERTKAIYEALL